jgi:hypothetical protein
MIGRQLGTFPSHPPNCTTTEPFLAVTLLSEQALYGFFSY